MSTTNTVINATIAAILTISPHFFDEFKISLAEVKKMQVKAQQRADYMLKTGDMSDLAGLDMAVSEMHLYQSQFKNLMPVIAAIEKKIGPIDKALEQINLPDPPNP